MEQAKKIERPEKTVERKVVKVEEKKSSTQNKYSLPYGLCAKYGISLPNNATPTDAWNALKGIGIKPSEVYKELQQEGDTDNLKPEGEKVVETKKETKDKNNNEKEKEPVKKKNVSELTDEEKAKLLQGYWADKYGGEFATENTYTVKVSAGTFDAHYGKHEEFTNYVDNKLGIANDVKIDNVPVPKQDESIKEETKEQNPSFSEEAYSEERKNNATNSTDPKVYDKMARQKTYDTWKTLSHAEKFATVDYTGAYSKFNEPLRGIEYGTNKFLGEGNVDMENIGVSYGGFKKGEIKKRIDDLTNAINKSSYDKDAILRRGTGYNGMSNFFKGVDEYTLRHASEKELTKLLVGNTYTDGGFMSCGSTKGKGFQGDIKFSIYCPKGTKMMYVEPVSKYGAQYGVDWKGQPQTHFNSENETVIQRGTSFRVTKVERLPGGKMYVQMEVVKQI